MRNFAIIPFLFATLCMAAFSLHASAQGSAPGPQIDASLTELLSPQGDALILLPNHLDKSRLDFTYESLEVVDAWLSKIHIINKLEAGDGVAGPYIRREEGHNSILLAGLYLGEVVRQNAQQDWAWQHFDVFIANNPVYIEYYGMNAELDAVVLVSEQGSATPINTALKRILFGGEESLSFVANFLSTPVDMEQAMTAHPETDPLRALSMLPPPEAQSVTRHQSTTPALEMSPPMAQVHQPDLAPWESMR